jgi:uncharacterized membrane protein
VATIRIQGREKEKRMMKTRIQVLKMMIIGEVILALILVMVVMETHLMKVLKHTPRKSEGKNEQDKPRTKIISRKTLQESKIMKR